MAGQIEALPRLQRLQPQNSSRYEFYCNRWGNGYRTRSDARALGTLRAAPDPALRAAARSRAAVR